MSTSTLTRLAPTQVQLEISITPDELREARERAFRRLVKNARLPGFRQGKVPRKVFEAAYGTDTIASDAIDDVVPQVYAAALAEHALEPVDRPQVELLPENEDQPLRVKATVEVRPEITLGTYKGIEVEVPHSDVTDDDVERSLATIAKERATLVPVERAAALGDVVTIDYVGTIDGVAFDGGSAEKASVELDAQRFIPGFATGIAGMSAGQTRDISVTFPVDYAQSELAGKDARFAVVMHDVKEIELPAIDDEFAAAISEHATLQLLRPQLRERLVAMTRARERRAIGDRVMEKLLDAHEFALPETLVERELDAMLGDIGANAAREGISFEQFLESVKMTQEQLRADYRARAALRVKGTLLIESVGKAEKISATPADIAAEIASLARQYGQPVDVIRKSLGKNLASVADGIVRSKTLEFLIDNAVVVAPHSATTQGQTRLLSEE